MNSEFPLFFEEEVHFQVDDITLACTSIPIYLPKKKGLGSFFN